MIDNDKKEIDFYISLFKDRFIKPITTQDKNTLKALMKILIIYKSHKQKIRWNDGEITHNIRKTYREKYIKYAEQELNKLL